MSLRRSFMLGLATFAIALAVAPAASAKAGQQLEMYTLEGSAAAIAQAAGGVELAGVRQTASGIRADAVLTASERDKVAAAGVKVALKRNKKGQTVTEQAAAMAAGGFQVWRSWDEPGGIRDELFDVARRNPQLVKLEVLGRTHQGRELIALKVTQGAREVPDGSRPAVLYSSNQHAREWISLEVNRRLLNHFIARWRANDKAIKDLLKRTELWFVISANPDGYQYTFDVERLWRKNLRDNDGDGEIGVGDGVDPNRNFAEHWGYDNEGSAPETADETYRGPSAGSEPETRAMAGPHRPHQAEVPVEPALVRPVAAVPAGLAGRHARRRLPDLRRPRRPRRCPVGDPGLQPRPVCRHPLRHQRRDDGLRRHERGHRRLHARARRGDPGRGLRVPGRRGADPGRVREDPAVPPGPREVGLAPRDAGLAGGHQRRAVLPRRRRHRPAERADSRCSTSSSASPMATRRRCACSPSAASAPSRCATRSTAVRCKAGRRASGTAASTTAPATGRTTT